MDDKRKIIVIDDERDLSAIIKINLEQTGEFKVIEIQDPFQAEEICKKELPDLVLVDLLMPKRKGTEIVSAIKKQPETSKIPVIVMSGLGKIVFSKNKDKNGGVLQLDVADQSGWASESVHNKKEAHEPINIDGCIEKPFKTQALTEMIKEVLNNKNVD